METEKIIIMYNTTASPLTKMLIMKEIRNSRYLLEDVFEAVAAFYAVVLFGSR
jgi:hypothetical protein